MSIEGVLRNQVTGQIEAMVDSVGRPHGEKPHLSDFEATLDGKSIARDLMRMEPGNQTEFQLIPNNREWGVFDLSFTKGYLPKSICSAIVKGEFGRQPIHIESPDKDIFDTRIKGRDSYGLFSKNVLNLISRVFYKEENIRSSAEYGTKTQLDVDTLTELSLTGHKLFGMLEVLSIGDCLSVADRNGHVLRLIPILHGEDPSRILDPDGGKRTKLFAIIESPQTKVD